MRGWTEGLEGGNSSIFRFYPLVNLPIVRIREGETPRHSIGGGTTRISGGKK